MIRDEIKLLGLALRWWILFVMFIIAVMLIGTFGFGWFQTSTADYRGKVKQTEQVQADPNYRIAHYNSFFDQCASIQTLTTQLSGAKENLSIATTPEEKRDARANVTALSFQRTAAINQYNANAAKEDTEAHFLSSNLPYRIDQNAEVIECAA